MLDARIIPALGDVVLDQIGAPTLLDLAADLRAAGLAPASVNGHLAVVSSVLHDAHERGVIATAPPRIPHQRVDVLHLELDDVERAAVLDAFDRAPAWAARLRPVYVLAVETGIRRGDLLRLRWDNVKDERITFTTSKTGAPVSVPISDAAAAALQELEGQDPDLVAPVSITTLSRAWSLVKQTAGIRRRCRWHDATRHTFASSLASKNVSLLLIQRALGHRTPAMTIRYAKPDASSDRVVLGALNELRNERVRKRDQDSGGAERDRTVDLLNAIQALSQTELQPHSEGREK